MERPGDETGERPADADAVALARAYYRALDDHDYDLLGDLLAVDFVQERPDQTLEGRERFVRFMRDERPQSDTSHPIDGIFRPVGGDAHEGAPVAPGDVVVQGRLLAGDGSRITAFVDVFDVEDGRLAHLRTFTH